MTTQLIEFSYLLSAICFILALIGLTSRSASIGNILGILGVLIALIATFNLPYFNSKVSLLITIMLGGALGSMIGNKISIKNIPRGVAGMHSLVGLAIILVTFNIMLTSNNIRDNIGEINIGALLAISFSTIMGSITFSGSVTAFTRLNSSNGAGAVEFFGRQLLCITFATFLIPLIYFFTKNQTLLVLSLIIFTSLILGVILIVFLNINDMNASISLLNSYCGFGISGVGFLLSNNLLIIAGALIGSSGAVLSYIMCIAKRRSLFNVIFSAFIKHPDFILEKNEYNRIFNATNAQDTALMLANARSIIIVPGYGLASSGGQYALKELIMALKKAGVLLRIAVHPQAGRMQGHMNIILHEANISYEDIYNIDEINKDFSSADIALVIGANDITNEAATFDKTTILCGMPVLNVSQAKKVIFIKRSMSLGYAACENDLFYQSNSLMLFGDAKAVIGDIIKVIAS